MKLTDEECRRGIISWQMAGPAIVRVRNPAQQGMSGNWSAPLTEAKGSLSPISLEPGIEIAVVPSEPSTAEQPFRVRWQALMGENVVTSIWNALDATSTLVMEMPDLGSFQRIRIATPYLAWEEEARVWEDGNFFAFELVESEGQVIVPVEPPAPGELLPQQLKAVSSTVRQGAVEIVASGSTASAAAVQASALLGFLALVLGDEVVGPVLYRADYEATPEETRVVMHSMDPTTHDHMIRPVLSVASDVIDLIAVHIPIVLGAGKSPQGTDALRVALSAYERAVRSRNILEQFLACFIGVEAIVTAYADESGLRGLFAGLQDDLRFQSLLSNLKGEYNAKDLGRLREGLGRPSNPERFGHYAKQHGIGKEARRSFHDLNGLRNKIAHGNSALVGLEDAVAAKQLLVDVLKVETGLPSPLPWERILRFNGVTMWGTIPREDLRSREWLSTIRLFRQESV